MELYEWQKEAYEELKKHDFKGVVKVASGKGKTVLAIRIIKDVLEEDKNNKALVVVPTINLMYQWRNEIKKFLPNISSSFYFGGKKDLSGRIVLSVINTASKLEFNTPFTIKILDEIHHYGSELYTGIFSLQTDHTIGLSATPEREDEGDLAIRYGAGKIVYSLSNVEELKERFHLCNIRVSLELTEYQRYMDLQREYYQLLRMAAIDVRKVTVMAKRGNKFALRILKIWSQQAKMRHTAKNKIDVIKTIVNLEKDKKIIIFSESIEFSETIGDVLGAIVVHSQMSKKEVIERLEDFRKRKSAVLVAPRLIDEGYDVPDANIAIVASFTRSSRQMIQRDGRVLRRKDFVRRYTLIIESVEEEKFFSIIRKTNMIDLAKDGLWLRFTQGFIDDSDCKKLFEEYLENDEPYEDWLKQKLNLYNLSGQIDVGFYHAHSIAIERLKIEFPNRWSILKSPEKKKKLLFSTGYSKEEQIKLKDQLRKINAKLLLPDEIFLALMRFIESEEFELDDESREYFKNVASEERRKYWPEELFEAVSDLVEKI
ncbi:MAG: DEAD/DEAH box helicase [Nanoarchaeota archaeon]|nr:DEAD/DEAH box helicase [Nanoarchaeota archaeon]